MRTITLGALAMAAACQDLRTSPRPSPVRTGDSSALHASATALRPASSPPAASTPALSSTPTRVADAPPRASVGPSSANVDSADQSATFTVDELVDIGPAGPAAAHPNGVVLVDKSDTLHLARRGAAHKGTRSAPSPIASLDLPRDVFAPYGRAPAIAGGYAYWVSRGRLVRRSSSGNGELQVLTTDARNGTRVAAGAVGEGFAIAAYVAAPGSSKVARAKIWVEGGKTYELTPDGSGASSVALAQQASGWTVLLLDGRSGMTPVHARRIVPRNKDVTIGPDVVVWVGASAQSTTEVVAAARGDDVWGLVAIELDVVRFGLAQVHVGTEPRMDAPVSFVTFENGVDTAPVATTAACGRTLVVFARPATKEPGSPAELVLAELGDKGLSAGSVIARSKAFADASLAGMDAGALLAYTADHRTWGATIRCRR